MDPAINNNSQYNIDALPSELKLHICEYLPTDTLRLLFGINKHWKRIINTFYGKCRSLAIDSYQNTVWALSRFSRIENISLRTGYTPSDNILTAIANSKSCMRLRRVDFSVPKYSLNVPVVNHGLRALAESASCATLEDLNLNRVSVRFFAPLTRFSHLTSLQLNSVGSISDRDISKIISSCTRLEELDLSSSLASDKADNVLVELAHYCSNLRTLSVQDCSKGITGKTLGKLFMGCSQLTKLDVSGCYRINRLEDFKTFVTHATTLQWLSLSKCVSITNQVVSVLCTNCTRLQFLSLSGCDRLTDEILYFVGQLPVLKEIHIGHCQMISKEGIEEFEEHYPNLRVVLNSGWLRKDEFRKIFIETAITKQTQHYVHMGHEKPFIKPVYQLAGSFFEWSPVDLHLLSIDFNANRTQKYNVKLFNFPTSADTGFPVRSDVIATTGCLAPPLALKWRTTNDSQAHPRGLFGFCCSSGHISLVNPNSAINNLEATPEDLISIRLEEDPLLDFEFANDDFIYALNKKKLMKWKRGAEQWSSFVLPDVYSTYISRERNYSLSWANQGTLIAAGKTISLFGNDESISNVLSFDSKFISQMKWNPFRENCFAVSYVDSPVIEFFDTRKLDAAYESLSGHVKGINSFNWGVSENQFISVDKNNIAIRWGSGKILSQQFMPNCYDIKYSLVDPTYYAGYSASRTWICKMDREDEVPTTVTYLDSDLLVIDSEPEDALIPSLITRIDLQKLRSEETKEKEIKKLCDEVHRKSYAVITLPQELFQKFIAAREIFNEFCALEESVKNSIHIYPGRDVGYNNIPNVKEFFQMRRVAEEEKFPWPPGLPKFQELITEIWNFQEELSREIMSYMATGIGMKPEKFLDLMDPLVLPPNEFSHSIMGLYHYFQHDDLTETCYTHKDMGLISFIPRSIVAGLQVVDYDSNLWLDVEQVAQPTDVVMIVCETLDRITGGYYPANNHRVVGTTDRHSIVFKLRARNDAVIDTANLGSPYISAIISEEYSKPVTVGNFVDTHLKTSESINFPGASFDNYKNCILNPNMNYTGLRSEKSGQLQSEMYM